MSQTIQRLKHTLTSVRWSLSQEIWPFALYCFTWSQTLIPHRSNNIGYLPGQLVLGPGSWGSSWAECPGFRANPKLALPILQLTEKLLDLENENMMRVAELEKQLLQREKELESIKVPATREGGATAAGCQGLRVVSLS